MPVRVRLALGLTRRVGMAVVLVVPVPMLVRHGSVRMRMLVPLGQMQP